MLAVGDQEVDAVARLVDRVVDHAAGDAELRRALRLAVLHRFDTVRKKTTFSDSTTASTMMATTATTQPPMATM